MIDKNDDAAEQRRREQMASMLTNIVGWRNNAINYAIDHKFGDASPPDPNEILRRAKKIHKFVANEENLKTADGRIEWTLINTANANARVYSLQAAIKIGDSKLSIDEVLSIAEDIYKFLEFKESV